MEASVRNRRRRPRHVYSTGALAGMLAVVLLLAASGGANAYQSQPADPSGTQTVLDPCQVVTSSEASTVAGGAAYGTGLETVNDGGSRTCVYGSQTLNVLVVTVAQASDPDTAQADWSQQEAEAQSAMQANLPPGVTVTLTLNDVSDLPGFDRAALGQASETIAGRTLNGSAIYLLKGATFVTFSDLVVGQAAPTSDLLESEAQTILGRLP